MRQLISGFFALSYELHSNKLRAGEMKASSTTYYFSRSLARPDAVERQLPTRGDQDLKRAVPYPHSRFNLENHIHPCNIHPFSEGNHHNYRSYDYKILMLGAPRFLHTAWLRQRPFPKLYAARLSNLAGGEARCCQHRVQSQLSGRGRVPELPGPP